MPRSFLKVLRLEETKGFNDTAVVGGLDRFLQRWAGDIGRWRMATSPLPTHPCLCTTGSSGWNGGWRSWKLPPGPPPGSRVPSPGPWGRGQPPWLPGRVPKLELPHLRALASTLRYAAQGRGRQALRAAPTPGSFHGQGPPLPLSQAPQRLLPGGEDKRAGAGGGADHRGYRVGGHRDQSGEVSEGDRGCCQRRDGQRQGCLVRPALHCQDVEAQLPGGL